MVLSRKSRRSQRRSGRKARRLGGPRSQRGSFKKGWVVSGVAAFKVKIRSETSPLDLNNKEVTSDLGQQ